MGPLSGKRGLIVGIANAHGLACGCARQFGSAGAELALTHLNSVAEPFVRPLAQDLRAPDLRAPDLRAQDLMPCDVTVDDQMDEIFARITKDWDRLDFVLHSIAYARKEDLNGRITNCSARGFALEMQVSAHSFLRMAKLSEPPMDAGGALLAMSYYGAEKAVAHHNVMGPVKAALEAAVRCMAVELGQAGIRVNALSPCPRATLGIEHFDRLLARAALDAPEYRLVAHDEVGAYAAFLVSDAAKAIAAMSPMSTRATTWWAERG